jgi:hypothetical protein
VTLVRHGGERRRGRALRLLLAVAGLLAATACQPSLSFQPDGACIADGRAPATYPELEGQLPTELGGNVPTSRDSGRSCSDQRLGTLRSHGVTDLRYAGATWAPEGGSSTVIALFTTAGNEPHLDPTWIENIQITHPVLEGAGTVYRLDTLNELSFQSVVVWPGTNVVHAVLVATELRPGGLTRADHDDAVRAAVLAAATSSPG